LCAEEAGSGHYMPGQTASFIDVLPGPRGVSLCECFHVL
jgi:hypothetical protein